MTRRALFLFAALGVMWGIPYLFINVAVRDLAPPVVMLGRCALGALVLMPFAIRSGELRKALKMWPHILVFAAIEMVLAWLLLGDSLQHIPSSLGALLIASVPLFATALALLLRIEKRLTARRVAGLLIGLTGVGFLAGLGAYGGGGDAPLRPVLQVLLVALCYAIGPMIIAKRLGGVSSVAVIAVALTFASIMHVPLAAANWPTSTPPASAIGSVLILGIFPTALAFAMMLPLIDEVGPAPATVVTYLNQAVALLAGLIFLSEPFTSGIAIGFPLVLLGAFLVTWRARRGELGQHSPVDG